MFSLAEKTWGALNPLTDFLAHHVMVDDRQRRLPEQRARHAERMRVSRRIQVNATGPDALSAQRSVREVNHDRQCHRRERLNAQCLVSDRVPSSPPILPLTGPVALSVQCSMR